MIGTNVDLAVDLDISVGDLWELIWRPRGQEAWLGPATRVPLQPSERLSLADPAGIWRTGLVTKVSTGHFLRAELEPPPTWSGPRLPTQLEIGLEPSADAMTTLRISERGALDTRQAADAEAFWQAALRRVGELVDIVSKRRESPRQALVVIHGIGEQEPGRTLRDLLRSGVLTGEVGRPEEANQPVGRRDEHWIKPDLFSASFELRRATIRASRGRAHPETEVYELYWAHLVRDTTTSQVLTWVRGLLLRWPVPRPLRPAWLAAWVVIGLVLAVVLSAALDLWDPPDWLAPTSLLAAVALVVYRSLVSGFLINRLGDAARYLRPTPDNIARRQAIRQAGVDLLERLHESGRYDRVIVLGHSLGGVIAYDVVTHAWIRMHRRHLAPQRPSFTAIRAVERAIGDRSASIDTIQELQHEAWRQLRRNSQPWLVTDLVTAGTPLTYADFLMGMDDRELAQAKADRVLPTCPPVTEPERRSRRGVSEAARRPNLERVSFDTAYRAEPDRSRRTFTSLHHAAPFAVTRWTNLYFPARRFGLSGDPIGGPLQRLFGTWVRDVVVTPPTGGFAHTRYWFRSKDDRRGTHLEALRTALRLRSGDDLAALAGQIPAYVFVEPPEEREPAGHRP